MTDRAQWHLEHSVAGLGRPWPQVTELARAMPPGSWTLIGGLMVHLHALHAGLEPQRPTVDVDIVLHVETDRASWNRAEAVLTALGYRIQRSIDLGAPAHRFMRARDVIDVLIADHVAPRALRERTTSMPLLAAPGGTSALRKTVDCTIEDGAGGLVVISVPDVLGALSIKGGAYTADSRDRDRHLEDAVLLAATVEDADGLTEDAASWTGSDARRIRALSDNLPDDHQAWGQIPRRLRPRAQASLRVLAGGPVDPT